MTISINEKQTKTVPEKTAEQTVEPAHENTQKAPNPFDEVQACARMAYVAYMEAQRDVANAYRARDRQDQEEFKEVEREAYKSCEKEIEKALRAREKAEQDAYEKCKSAKEKAAQVYEENVREALIACKETIDKAWKVSRETSEQMWTLFQAGSIG